MEEKDPKELARHEIGWWKSHPRKETDGLIDHMAQLYVLQYSIPYEEAKGAVMLRVEATKEHDIAEKLEDEGIQPEADVHWQKAEDLLVQHFAVLYHKNEPAE
ncbi:hypothetical protein JW707_04675 [Candidatus Woesearchaeota archaeon]|nr:hypothetical protein [Candidatus Woesearchaeota archaeon]